MAGIPITDNESAINFWRDKLPCLKAQGCQNPRGRWPRCFNRYAERAAEKKAAPGA